MRPRARALRCRGFARVLQDYVAGDLSAEDRRVVDAHLAECPECAAYLRTYADTVRLARAAHEESPAPPTPPERLVRAILALRGPRAR